MAVAGKTTIVSVFDSVSEAQSAIQSLVSAGVRREDISLVANDREGQYQSGSRTGSGDSGKLADPETGKRTADGTTVGENVAAGTGFGALGGLLIGLGALAIPGVGPIVAAGPLAAALGGALAGAAGGGIIGALKDAGVPDDDASFYAEHVRRGGVMLTVHTDENMADRVSDMLDRAGAVQVQERESEYRASGWSGFDANAKPYTDYDRDQQMRAQRPAMTGTTQRGAQQLDQQGQQAIPIVEEELAVGKRTVERGGVRVYSHVTERPVEEQVRLRDETVRVERRPVNRDVRPEDLNSMRDQTIEMREYDEEAVVGKRARVVEEVVVGKEASERTETVRDTVRRTDVEVEQLGATGAGATSSYDADFRQHFTSTFGSKGRYEDYAPAYQYGSQMGGNAQYRGRSYDDVENTIKTDYLRNNPNSKWDNVKGAVRYGWEKASGKR